MISPIVYRNVESVLSVLNNHATDTSQPVSALLEIYDKALNTFKEDEEKNPKTAKHPLIILEGLDGCGKSTTCKKLATKLNAAKWCTPPESTKHIRDAFNDHPELGNAYYALGNYIAALECSIILKKQPVVMDRYWHSTSAYALAQAVHDFPEEVEIPPEGDSFYLWPNDLLKPDAVIFLNVSENIRLQRLSRRTTITTQESLLKSSQQFRNNIILAYRNMVDPKVIFVDSNLTVNKVVFALQNELQNILK